MMEQCEIRVGEMLTSKCGAPTNGKTVPGADGRPVEACDYHYSFAAMWPEQSPEQAPLPGTRVRIDIGDSVHEWIITGTVVGMDYRTEELIVHEDNPATEPIRVAWPEAAEGMTIL